MKGKISAEEKERLVKGYLEGTISISEIKREYGLHHAVFHEWVRRYKARGPNGFIETKNRKYEASLKRQAVEEYLSGEGSLIVICDKYDISDKKTLREWIMCYNRCYSVNGIMRIIPLLWKFRQIGSKKQSIVSEKK